MCNKKKTQKIFLKLFKNYLDCLFNDKNNIKITTKT